MNFIIVKEAIITLLKANAGTDFEVVESQRQSQGVSTLPRVQVFYKSGDFPKSGGSATGKMSHDAVFQVNLLVSEPAKGDLTALENATTDAERQTAIATIRNASLICDENIDLLFAKVYQILMHHEYRDLGLEIGTTSNKWVDNYDKGDPIPHGDHIVLSGACSLTLRITEGLQGISVVNLEDISTDLTLKDDDNAKQGITNDDLTP